MRGTLNIEKAFFPSCNEYGFPEIEGIKEQYSDVDWFSFNQREKAKIYYQSGLHFFIDDYCFDSVWNNPDKYIECMKKYKYVIQPDFSMYYNFPVALQIFNKYRNHWLARYYSFYGVSVIPNINVSTPDCWEWSFIGYPKNSVVAFSDIGSVQKKSDRTILINEYDEMIKRLEPLQVIYFTRNIKNVPSECISVVVPYKDKI